MTMLKRNTLDSPAGAATYIAPGTKIVGDLSGEGTYFFCGEIEGECDINGPITIAEGSYWKGSVRATEIILAGSVDGDIIAKERVEIAGTAHITGSLRGSSIVVAEGAVIEDAVNISKTKETERPKVRSGLQVSPARS